jgi:hypothetical protein
MDVSGADAAFPQSFGQIDCGLINAASATAQKQTLPVWAGSVVLHGSDAAGLIPVAPEWMSHGIEDLEASGFKIN